MDFENFCGKWVDFCIGLEKKKLTKAETIKIKGDKFEEEFYPILKEYVPEGYRIVPQTKIKGINYTFDFIFARSDYGIRPEEVIAVFEVKSHGFFSYNSIIKTGKLFKAVRHLNPQIHIFYITFRETNTYDKKVKELLGDFVENYYRFSDSGDGLQLPPKKYFSESWNRMIRNLLEVNVDENDDFTFLW